MSLRKQLKQAWDALDYADVGEFLPYAEKCRLLGVAPPLDCTGYLPPAQSAQRSTVALKLGRNLDPHAFDYAIDLARGLEAGLVLLRPPGYDREAIPGDFEHRIDTAGMGREEVALTSPWFDSLTAFLRRRTDIVCLILGATDLDWRALTSAAALGRGRSFPAPVVVVEGAFRPPHPA